MELEEKKISYTAIKQYLLLIKSDLRKFDTLEFKTLKGWFVYSLSVALILTVPCGLIIFIAALLSENMSFELSISLFFVPIICILPLILLFTFVNNYRRPKKQQKQLLQVLNRHDWDGPIKQVGPTHFECIKHNYFFRTEMYLRKNEKGLDDWLACMFTPYYLPVENGKEEEYLKDIDAYLDGKSLFLIKEDMAYFGVPMSAFMKLNLKKDIEQLLYVLQRFNLHPCTYYNPVDIVKAVPDTPAIQALTTFDQYIDHRWTDWAKNTIEAGFVNENLKNFAEKIPGKENQKELKEQMETLIREFNLYLTKEGVFNNYICYLLIQEEEGKISILKAIQSLSDLYISSGLYPLSSFNRLYKAKIALDETGEQNFWTETELSADTIDVYIRTFLQTWLDEEVEFLF